MTDCVFCKIVRKEIPAEIISENDTTIAFLDIRPRAPGHTVVIPKLHVPDFLSLPRPAVAPLFQALQDVTAKIKRALKPDGFTFGINQGKASGQEVEHLHLHIFPRFYGDGGLPVQAVVENNPEESLADISNKIRNTV
jgi:histidine triad (HIT) family protein